jgi:hypothetical protein
VEDLNGLFVDDEGFFSFVASMDEIRAEGVLTELSFPGNVTTGRSRHRGQPINMVFVGDQVQINDALSKVLGVPFLLEPVNAELEAGGEQMVFRFGVLLLVDDDFAKN